MMLTGMAKREEREERGRLTIIRRGWNDLYCLGGQQAESIVLADLSRVNTYWEQSSSKLEQEHWTAIYTMVEEYILDNGWKAP